MQRKGTEGLCEGFRLTSAKGWREDGQLHYRRLHGDSIQQSTNRRSLRVQMRNLNSFDHGANDKMCCFVFSGSEERG